ncbi:MAG: hypothetical protein GYA65_03490 [Actinobacteria bacterium]|jgi:hypothetical protein|nr:hypothetical protein [Acidimicrobiaceae bacterium]MBP6487928.1 hypothetical protein [Ilumatobacteraceae bacterium]NMD23228.1 hypothetical protein [Actinomycetota bacterium]MBK9972046.1 hypothetical protein [Acidimicrobiaceae bacterium]MBP7889868.1 hypothetical protein [Ilumatobacteraceae bacterium]
MNVGRIIGTAVVGFLFLLFVALDLVLFGVLALNSVMVTVLPLLGLLAGGALGALVGKRRAAG